MPEDFERGLRRKEAAAFLTNRGYPTAAATLAKLACTGGGPEFVSYGRIPLYAPAKLLEWALSRCRVRHSTSDPGAPKAA